MPFSTPALMKRLAYRCYAARSSVRHIRTDDEFKDMHRPRSYSDFGHAARAPLKQIGTEPLADGAVSRPHVRVQRLRDAAYRPDVSGCRWRRRGTSRSRSWGPRPATQALPPSRRFKGLDNVDVCHPLPPWTGQSEVQRRQMSTPRTEANVHALAVDGHVRRLPARILKDDVRRLMPFRDRSKAGCSEFDQLGKSPCPSCVLLVTAADKPGCDLVIARLNFVVPYRETSVTSMLVSSPSGWGCRWDQ